MADAHYPPSDLRLQRLREQGIVPFSRDLSTFYVFVAIALVLLGVGLFLPLFFQKITIVLSGFWSGEGNPLEEIPSTAILMIAGLLVAVALLRAAVVLLGGLLQNRFLWSTSPLFRSPGILSFRAFSAPGSRIIESVFRVLLGTAVFLGGVLALRYVLLKFDSLSVVDFGGIQSGSQLAEAVQAYVFVLFRILLAITILLLFLGVLSRLVVVERFRRSHRMSREELEAEFRETEPSPEMRDRQRQRD